MAAAGGDVPNVRGLVNTGNTCFLNAILQALACVPSAHDFLRGVVLAERQLRSMHAANAAISLHFARMLQRSDDESDLATDDASPAFHAATPRSTRDAAASPLKFSAAAVEAASVDSDSGVGLLACKLLCMLMALSHAHSGHALFSGAALNPGLALGSFSSSFDDSQQQDAHELLLHLLRVCDDDGMAESLRALAVIGDAIAARVALAHAVTHAPSRMQGEGVHAPCVRHIRPVPVRCVTSPIVESRGAPLSSTSTSVRSDSGLSEASSADARSAMTMGVAGAARLKAAVRARLQASDDTPNVRSDFNLLQNPFTGVVASRIRCLACEQRVALTHGPGISTRAAVAQHSRARPWILDTHSCLSVELHKPAADSDAAAVAAAAVRLRGIVNYDAAATGAAPTAATAFVLHVEECLAAYFDGELIDGYSCDAPTCTHVYVDPFARGATHNARKETRWMTPPRALVVHFKRNQFASRIGGVTKTNRRVNFASSMCVAPLIQARSDARPSSDGSDAYDLMAVVEHLGGAHGGHYVTYRRVAMPVAAAVAGFSNHWVRASDESVVHVSWEDVCAREAYMLFYARRDTRARMHGRALLHCTRSFITTSDMHAALVPSPLASTMIHTPDAAAATLSSMWARTIAMLHGCDTLADALQLSVDRVKLIAGDAPLWLQPAALTLLQRWRAHAPDSIRHARTAAVLRHAVRGAAMRPALTEAVNVLHHVMRVVADATAQEQVDVLAL